MSKRKKLFLPADLPEGATNEQRIAFAKERLILSVIKTVYAGLILLVTLFVLFVPCFSYTINSKYAQGVNIKYSVSTVQAMTTNATKSERKADIEFLKSVKLVEYLQTHFNRRYENREAPKQNQVIQEIEYIKNRDLGVMEKVNNVYRFIDAMNQNLSDYADYLRKNGLFDSSFAGYDTNSKKFIGYLINNFRYDIEYRNFSGLNFFMKNTLGNMTDNSADELAKKYLINTYNSVQEMPNEYKKYISCIPYYYESFALEKTEDGEESNVTIDNVEYRINSYSDGNVLGAFAYSIFAYILSAFNLIYLIVTIISVVKMYIKRDYPFKPAFANIVLPLFIPLFITAQLFSFGEIVSSAISIGAIVIMVLSIMSFVSHLIYNNRLKKVEQRFFAEKKATDTVTA